MKKILFLVLVLFIFYEQKTHSKSTEELYKKIDLFSEVLEKIQNEYVDEINQADVMDSAINGVLQSLDPYSSYMNPEIFDEM